MANKPDAPKQPANTQAPNAASLIDQAMGSKDSGSKEGGQQTETKPEAQQTSPNTPAANTTITSPGGDPAASSDPHKDPGNDSTSAIAGDAIQQQDSEPKQPPKILKSYRVPSAPCTIHYYHEGKLLKHTAYDGVVKTTEDTDEGLIKHMEDMLKQGLCRIWDAIDPVESWQIPPEPAATHAVPVKKAGSDTNSQE